MNVATRQESRLFNENTVFMCKYLVINALAIGVIGGFASLFLMGVTNITLTPLKLGGIFLLVGAICSTVILSKCFAAQDARDEAEVNAARDELVAAREQEAKLELEYEALQAQMEENVARTGELRDQRDKIEAELSAKEVELSAKEVELSAERRNFEAAVQQAGREFMSINAGLASDISKFCTSRNICFTKPADNSLRSSVNDAITVVAAGIMLEMAQKGVRLSSRSVSPYCGEKII